MNSDIVVQKALVAALATLEGVGVFDGPPARAAYPYVAIDGGFSTDWSTKTAAGREHRIAVTLWDDGRSAARLHALMAEVGSAIEAMPRALEGCRVASLVFLRSRVTRDAAGPWAGIVEYRVRVMAT